MESAGTDLLVTLTVSVRLVSVRRPVQSRRGLVGVAGGSAVCGAGPGAIRYRWAVLKSLPRGECREAGSKTAEFCIREITMAKSIAQECPHMKAAGSAQSSVSAKESASRDLAPMDLPVPSIPKWKANLRFLTQPFQLISEVRAECGDLFLMELPGLGRVVFLCRADLLHEVYRYGEDEVVAGEMRGRHLAALMGDKVSVCLDGDEFKDRRRIIAPYLNGKQVEQCLPRIVGYTEEMIDELRSGAEEELQPRFDHLTQRTIASILFGGQPQEKVDELAVLAHRFLEAFQWRTVQVPFLRRSLGPWSPWSRFLKRRAEFSRVLEAEARRAAASGDTEASDLMSAMVVAGLYEDPEEVIDAVVQEMIGLVVGGAETTSKALSWCLRGLLSRPETKGKLQEELDRLLGDRPMTARDLKDLPYLHAVIHEGLRHQSVGPFAGPRLAKKEIVVGGYRIPPETAMVQALHEVGRGPHFPDSESFDPEHFFGREVKQRDWVPFGGGIRKCTGMGLALVELAGVIGTLVQRTEMELGSGSMEPIQAGIAHKPRNDMRVKFTGRRSGADPS